MEGNPTGPRSEAGLDSVHYVVRITFGLVHGVLLTLLSFGLALFFPSLSHFLFALFGCIVAPALSFVLTLFCNTCVGYVSQSQQQSLTRMLQTAWIPPLGVFCASLILLPLESFRGVAGPLPTLVATSVVVNFILTTLLQIYAAREIQSSSSETSGGSSPT
jgi:hypothetical protein